MSKDWKVGDTIVKATADDVHQHPFSLPASLVFTCWECVDQQYFGGWSADGKHNFRWLPTKYYRLMNTEPESTEPEPTEPVSAEVRVTSSTGGSKGKKPQRMSLVPVDALWELLSQYGNGADKYPSEDGLDNWRHGYEWSLSFDAAFRHLLQALNGEDYDEELNVKHVLATAWHCLTIAHFMNRPDLSEFDDRQSTVLKKYLAEHPTETVEDQ